MAVSALAASVTRSVITQDFLFSLFLFSLFTALISTDVFTEMTAIAREYLLCIWFLEFLTVSTL